MSHGRTLPGGSLSYNTAAMKVAVTALPMKAPGMLPYCARMSSAAMICGLSADSGARWPDSTSSVCMAHDDTRRDPVAYTAWLNMFDPVPAEIKLRTTSRVLEVSFADGSRFQLPFEYLRVHSPSAEVQGHGPGQEVLVLGKENVGIKAVEPGGHYAVKLVFD